MFCFSCSCYSLWSRQSMVQEQYDWNAKGNGQITSRTRPFPSWQLIPLHTKWNSYISLCPMFEPILSAYHLQICPIPNPWTTLEEDYILTWGPVLKPVQVSVSLSLSIKTCLIQLVHFGAGNKECYVVLF
jgi:hypothetical protein